MLWHAEIEQRLRILRLGADALEEHGVPAGEIVRLEARLEGCRGVETHLHRGGSDVAGLPKRQEPGG